MVYLETVEEGLGMSKYMHRNSSFVVVFHSPQHVFAVHTPCKSISEDLGETERVIFPCHGLTGQLSTRTMQPLDSNSVHAAAHSLSPSLWDEEENGQRVKLHGLR